jgi:hypothetical protein
MACGVEVRARVRVEPVQGPVAGVPADVDGLDAALLGARQDVVADDGRGPAHRVADLVGEKLARHGARQHGVPGRHGHRLLVGLRRLAVGRGRQHRREVHGSSPTCLEHLGHV